MGSNRTIVILGKALNACRAPRQGVERWGINGSYKRLAERLDMNPEIFDGYDRWFDLHTLGHIRKHREHALEWYRSRRDTSKPLYFLPPHLDSTTGGLAWWRGLPVAREFPMEAIQRHYAPIGVDVEEFFTSSLDWLLAYAGREDDVTRIELWGVDLWAKPHERGTQRNGGHYWIGMLRGMGVEVFIPDESSMCKAERLYGPFTETNGRNFSSMNLERFLGQVKTAERMRATNGENVPGVDAGHARDHGGHEGSPAGSGPGA